MWELVMTFVAGGGFAAFLMKLMDFWHEKSIRKAEKEQREQEKLEAYEETYLSEKKAVYLDVLSQLAEIKFGFNEVISPLSSDTDNLKRVKQMNEGAAALSARMRLYSSDEVYNLYWQLAQWSIFAYTRPTGAWRLGEDGKRNFSIYTTVLARLMQAELGFRELISDPEKVVCPNCGVEHDAYKTCQCGWTYSKTFEAISRKMQEQMEREDIAKGKENINEDTI